MTRLMTVFALIALVIAPVGAVNQTSPRMFDAPTYRVEVQSQAAPYVTATESEGTITAYLTNAPDGAQIVCLGLDGDANAFLTQYPYQWRQSSCWDLVKAVPENFSTTFKVSENSPTLYVTAAIVTEDGDVEVLTPVEVGGIQ